MTRPTRLTAQSEAEIRRIYGHTPFVADLLAELDALRLEHRHLKAAAAKVVEGFDRGLFVRDTGHDDDAGWGMRVFPYVKALADLSPAPPDGDSR